MLDVSGRALNAVAERLGGEVHGVELIRHDVLTWVPSRRYALWHDRAVFHFLTEPAARVRYVETAARAVRIGGTLVLGTFAEDGPTSCSGLPVSRASPEDLAEAFGDCFTPVHHEREDHITPTGVVQPFTWVVLERT